MDILNNPWFVGVGGGILSGLIVTFISRAFLSRRDQREYAQKVLGANREIIYAIRPGISEGLLPTSEILASLIQATARKFGVDSQDLFTPSEIAQELIKEVMDSSFISAKIKENYCANLAAIATVVDSVKTNQRNDNRNDTLLSGIEAYRSRMVTMMSMMVGLLVAVMTLVFALRSDKFTLSETIPDSKDNAVTLLLPALSAILSVALSTLAATLYRELRRRSKRDHELGIPHKHTDRKSIFRSIKKRQ